MRETWMLIEREGEYKTTTIYIPWGRLPFLVLLQIQKHDGIITSTRAQPMRAIEKIKTVTIRGKRYNLVVKKLKTGRGMTEHPNTKNKTVYIDTREKGKDLLATLIDEFIHCAIWEIENDVVDEISDDIADALWRCGLRFTDEETPKD